MKSTLIFFTGLLLAGCVSIRQIREENPKTAAEVSAQTGPSRDKFSNGKTIFSPTFVMTSGKVHLILSLVKFEDGEISLRCVAVQSEWAFYEFANTLGGRVLPTRVLDRQVFSAEVLNETVAVTLTKNDLANPKGLPLKLFGKRGQVEFTVPAFLLEGFRLGAGI
jgi:hypothetical protein